MAPAVKPLMNKNHQKYENRVEQCKSLNLSFFKHRSIKYAQYMFSVPFATVSSSIRCLRCFSIEFKTYFNGTNASIKLQEKSEPWMCEWYQTSKIYHCICLLLIDWFLLNIKHKNINGFRLHWVVFSLFYSMYLKKIIFSSESMK